MHATMTIELDACVQTDIPASYARSSEVLCVGLDSTQSAFVFSARKVLADAILGREMG